MSEILIVDDELQLRKNFQRLFESEGFTVRTAKDGEEALKKIGEKAPDLVLLDVMMPKRNGYFVCEEIRKIDNLLPVIFLTALDGDVDEVRGRDLGADDYISKTESESVLLASIRRAIARTESLKLRGPEMLTMGKVSVDLNRGRVREGDKEISRLTQSEILVLKLLAGNRGHIFATAEIRDVARDEGYAAGDSLVRTLISRLKRKLGSAESLICSERGSGYWMST